MYLEEELQRTLHQLEHVPTIVEYALSHPRSLCVWYAPYAGWVARLWNQLTMARGLKTHTEYQYPFSHTVGFKNNARIKLVSPEKLHTLRGYEVGYLLLDDGPGGLHWIPDEALKTLLSLIRGQDTLVVASTDALSFPPRLLDVRAELALRRECQRKDTPAV